MGNFLANLPERNVFRGKDNPQCAIIVFVSGEQRGNSMTGKGFAGRMLLSPRLPGGAHSD
jgi:hypothetical protein